MQASLTSTHTVQEMDANKHMRRQDNFPVHRSLLCVAISVTISIRKPIRMAVSVSIGMPIPDTIGLQEQAICHVCRSWSNLP